MSLYIPGHFAPRDRSSVARLLHEHPFATLVTPSATEPFITHLPLIHIADCEPHGTLHGHFARTNPHVEAAAHGVSLALFHGPHAYVTPSWYEEPAGAVPTWNYAVAGLTAERLDAMVRAIVGFRIKVTRIDVKLKLSQNRSRDDRERVVEGLAAEGYAEASATAAWMRAFAAEP
jgi:transcriptional regulator